MTFFSLDFPIEWFGPSTTLPSCQWRVIEQKIGMDQFIKIVQENNGVWLNVGIIVLDRSSRLCREKNKPVMTVSHDAVRCLRVSPLESRPSQMRISCHLAFSLRCATSNQPRNLTRFFFFPFSPILSPPPLFFSLLQTDNEAARARNGVTLAGF